jgi:hypothetical protein
MMALAVQVFAQVTCETQATRDHNTAVGLVILGVMSLLILGGIGGTAVFATLWARTRTQLRALRNPPGYPGYFGPPPPSFPPSTW